MKNKTVIAMIFISLACCVSSPAAYAPSTGPEALRFGDQACFERDWDKAIRYFRLAANLQPASGEARVRMAMVYYSRGSYLEAQNELELAQKLKIGPVTKKFVRSALKKLEENKALLSAIQDASESSQDSGSLLLLHEEAAKKMAENGLYISLVAPHLDYLLKFSPASSRAILYFIADAYYASSDHRRAADYYLKLLPFEKENKALYIRLADCLVNIGMYTDARLYYKKALRLTVKKKESSNIGDLSKKIRALPRESGYLFYLLEREDYEELALRLKRYFSLNPSDPTAMALQGAVYEGIGQNFMAERLYQKIIKLYPEYPGGHLALGRFYLYKKKKFVEAAARFELFKETLAEYRPFNPKPDWVRRLKKDRLSASQSLAYIYLEVLRQPQKALAELESCVSENPEDAEIQYNVGCAYFNLKKRASAYKAFKRVMELKPGSDIAKEAEYNIEVMRKSPEHGAYTGPYD